MLFGTVPPTGQQTHNNSCSVAVWPGGRWRLSGIAERRRYSKVPAAAEIKNQSGGGTQTEASNWTS